MELLTHRPKLVDIETEIRQHGYTVQVAGPVIVALAHSQELGLTPEQREQFSLLVGWKNENDKKRYTISYRPGPTADVYLSPLLQDTQDPLILARMLQESILKVAALVPENMDSLLLESGATTWMLISGVLAVLYLNGEGVPKGDYATTIVWAFNAIACMISLMAIDIYNSVSRVKIEESLRERFDQTHFVHIQQISPDTMQNDE